METKSKFINAKIVDDKSYKVNNAKKIVVTYEEEQKDGLHRCIFSVPIFFSDYISIHTIPNLDLFPCDDVIVDLGFGSMNILSQNRLEAKDILIKERVEELTIEDIEKKLGYKIKIVNKKE